MKREKWFSIDPWGENEKIKSDKFLSADEELTRNVAFCRKIL